MRIPRFRRGERVLDISNVAPADTDTIRASGAVALICKATEGESFRDRVYPGARASARQIGIPFGGYLFLRPGSSPQGQADAFLAYAKPRPGDIQPIIDSEVTDGRSMAEVADAVLACANRLEAKNYTPILYASTSWLLSLYAERPQLRRLHVWQAEYPGWLPVALKARLRRRHRLGHGVSVVLWQYSSRWPLRRRRYDASYLLAPAASLLVPKPPAKPRPKPTQTAAKKPAVKPPRAKPKK